MPSFDIIKSVCPEKTFRVASVMGKFDLQSNSIQERFTGEINIQNDWQIGLIVGKSGTGKTTIAKQLFPDAYISGFNYTNETILDDFSENLSTDEIVKTFNAVGFSPPPSWLKPYEVLSNGEKMRVDLARAILAENGMFVFDEFTSVVDRQVAKIGSFAMQKAIRKTKKKFIAVTCHSDVEEWLLPDWIFDTNTMTFTEGLKKNRPKIEFKIFETTDKGYYWKMFSKYHYLSHSHNNTARVYIAVANNEVCGFYSVLNFPHPKIKGAARAHRIVVFPDYQGIGIASILREHVSKLYIEQGKRFFTTTSHPAVISSLKNNKQWICTHIGRTAKSDSFSKKGSQNRITTSWERVK